MNDIIPPEPTPAQQRKAQRFLAKIEKINQENNAKFKAATPAQRRVMIAKDIIARVKTKQYTPMRGDWASVEYGYGAAKGEDSIQTLINSGTQCSCCALGGLMLSCVAFKNRVTVSDVEKTNVFDGNDLLDGGDTLGLATLFGKKQLAMIEFCFEGSDGATDHADLSHVGVSARMIDRLDAFMDSWYSAEGTMLRIMGNIVRNRGTFKP